MSFKEGQDIKEITTIVLNCFASVSNNNAACNPTLPTRQIMFFLGETLKLV